MPLGQIGSILNGIAIWLLCAISLNQWQTSIAVIASNETSL